MPAKVILCFPQLDVSKEYHHLPVSALSVAAPLQRREIDCEIYDERVDPPARLDTLLSDAAVVGLTMFTGYQTYRAYSLLEKIKARNPEIVTVVGGPHVTALPWQTAEDKLVDYAVAGFGEAAFLELVSRLLKHGNADGSTIPGIYHKNMKNEGGPIAPIQFDHDFWSPLPYEKIDISKYINPNKKRVMYVSHYGCPGICTFCATPHYRQWTPKKLDVIAADLDKLMNIFPFHELCFFDATLFTNRQRVHDVIELLAPYPDLQWLADARAVELVKYSTEELASLATRTAHLQCLMVGLESGSPRIVESVMKKGRNHLAHFRTVAQRLHEADIPLLTNLIFGTPSETVQDLRQTIDYVSEIRAIHPGLRLSTTFFRPLPGTELSQQLDRQGYSRPRSLAEWAELGAGNHFEYNHWQDIPWMPDDEKTAYISTYREFMAVHGDIIAQ